MRVNAVITDYGVIGEIDVQALCQAKTMVKHEKSALVGRRFEKFYESLGDAVPRIWITDYCGLTDSTIERKSWQEART